MSYRKPIFRIGEEVQIALWVSDDDPPAKIKWWKELEVPRVFKDSARASGVEIGPITWRELKPGEDNAGHPPKKIQGTNVRLLIAEAEVVAEFVIAQDIDKIPFTAELSPKDLELLRTVTRDAYHPTPLTDAQCDKVINALGPEVMEKTLRMAICAQPGNETKH